MPAVAETLTQYEQERGKPMPSKNHALVQAYLTVAFMRYEQEYSVLPELSLDLGGAPLTPDISVYPKLPTDWRHDEVRLTEPPSLVVEILSPKQVMDDLVKKAEKYFEAGVKSCWIVLPVLQTIAVLMPDGSRSLHSDGDVTDPTTGIQVRLAEIFR